MRDEFNSPDARSWRPLSVNDVRPLVLDGTAWLSGGVALDAWLGFQSRQHGDVDISVFRGQWPDFASELPLWLCLYAAEDGILTPLNRANTVESANNIWCLDDRTGEWCLQVNLEDGDGEQWKYRRCHDVTAPWTRAVLTVDGLQIVAPEIQLLWKSKAPTPKDTADREWVLPRLDSTAQRWLDNAISIAHPLSPWNDRRSR